MVQLHRGPSQVNILVDERLLPLILMNAPAPLAAAVAFITLSVSIIFRHAAVIASNGRPWLPRLNKKSFFFPSRCCFCPISRREVTHRRVAEQESESSLQAEW